MSKFLALVTFFVFAQAEANNKVCTEQHLANHGNIVKLADDAIVADDRLEQINRKFRSGELLIATETECPVRESRNLDLPQSLIFRDRFNTPLICDLDLFALYDRKKVAQKAMIRAFTMNKPIGFAQQISFATKPAKTIDWIKKTKESSLKAINACSVASHNRPAPNS